MPPVVEPPNLMPPRSTCLPLDTKYSREDTKLHNYVDLRVLPWGVLDRIVYFSVLP